MQIQLVVFPDAGDPIGIETTVTHNDLANLDECLQRIIMPMLDYVRHVSATRQGIETPTDRQLREGQQAMADYLKGN